MAHERLGRLVRDELDNIKQLADVDLDLLAITAGALIDAAPTLTITSLSEAAARSTGRTVDEVKPVVSVLQRLAIMQRRVDKSTDAFVDSLTSCLNGLSEKQWTAEYREQWQRVVSDLKRVLSPRSAVYLSAKATELLFEQSLALCSARIITDMRPIFDDEAVALQGIVPFHTLVLRCHQSERSEHTNIYVAIDASDLRELREQIERAERKEKLMKERLSSAGYRIVTEGTEPNQTEVE